MNASKLRETILVVILLALGVMVRIAAVEEWSYDLKPLPDAMEYSLVANQLASLSAPVLTIDGHPYPSRYPLGTPLMLTPFALLFGGRLPWLFVGVLLYATLVLLLTYLFARQILTPAGAAIALAITALSPEHTRFSVLVMSEIPSGLLLLAIAFSWMRMGRERLHPVGTLLIGVVAGFATIVRYPNGLVLICLLVDVVRRIKTSEAGATRGLVLLLLGSALPVAGQLFANQLLFGSALENGYRYWEPNDYATGRAILLRHALVPDQSVWQNGGFSYYGKALLGLHPALYRPEVFALALLGTAVVWRSRHQRRQLILLALLPIVTFAFYCCYFFQAYRMLVPVLPFLAVLAAVPIDRLTSWRPGRLVGIGMPIVVVAALSLRMASPLREVLRKASDERPYASLPAFESLRGQLDRDAVIVWDLPLALGSRLLPGFELMPLTADGVDRHLAWIIQHDLAPIDGWRGRPVPLYLDRTILHPPSYERLQHLSQQGRRILFIHAHRGAATEMKDVIARYFTAKRYVHEGTEFFANGLWVLELVPRSGRGS
ncbi:MAG: glycosyltransferase family 39 protein [Planctomycetota bacterium]